MKTDDDLRRRLRGVSGLAGGASIGAATSAALLVAVGGVGILSGVGIPIGGLALGAAIGGLAGFRIGGRPDTERPSGGDDIAPTPGEIAPSLPESEG